MTSTVCTSCWKWWSSVRPTRGIATLRMLVGAITTDGWAIVAVMLHATTKQDKKEVNCQDVSQSAQGGDKSRRMSRQYDLFSLLCLPFSFSFTLLWVTWLYLVMSHMFSHMVGHLTCHMTKGTWSVTWPWTIFTSHMSHYDSLLCVSSILSLWLTLPNRWLPWELPCHWLILPHHTLQYDVIAYVYLPILSTPVVVYKSGILGTQSPRLDFTCNTVLVNWSPVRGELLLISTEGT